MYLFLLLLLLVVVIMIIDFIPQFYTWQSRIHIGRFVATKLWQDSVLLKSVQWLRKTPTIKLTDNTRLIFIDMLRGNYKRNAIQDWQQASLVLGLNQYFSATSDEKTKRELLHFVATKIASDGTWKQQPKEIDSVILSYAFLNCTFIDHHKNKPSYDFIYHLILNLKGSDGTIAYRKHVDNYRFVDTIGFICPFLVLYGLKFDIPEAIDLAVQQITTFNENGMLGDHFVPCHTYNVVTKFPVGLFGWGRGLGWYAIGLIDAWSLLPEDHASKKVLEQSVVSFAKMALQFQNENGSWSWIVLDKSSRMDSSTTATLAWFLTQASSIASLAPQCIAAKGKALDYLRSVTRRDGAIDFSQGDTKAIGVHSNEFDILPFTQGFCLRTIFK